MEYCYVDEVTGRLMMIEVDDVLEHGDYEDWVK